MDIFLKPRDGKDVLSRTGSEDLKDRLNLLLFPQMRRSGAHCQLEKHHDESLKRSRTCKYQVAWLTAVSVSWSMTWLISTIPRWWILMTSHLVPPASQSFHLSSQISRHLDGLAQMFLLRCRQQVYIFGLEVKVWMNTGGAAMKFAAFRKICDPLTFVFISLHHQVKTDVCPIPLWSRL